MAPRWESLRKVYCVRVGCKAKLNLGHISGLGALARGLPALPEQLRISVPDDLPSLRSRASLAISLLTNPKSSKILQPTDIPSPFQSTHASTLNSREKPAPNETVAIACKRSYPQNGGSANSKRGPLFCWWRNRRTELQPESCRPRDTSNSKHRRLPAHGYTVAPPCLNTESCYP